MEKLFIQNRNGQKISVIVDLVIDQKGLAFVMHGLGGSKDQSHLQIIASSFTKNNFTSIRFDTTNSFGESDGDYEDATLTNYYEDLEDVINWSKSQPWYQEPFVLVGHSLGGISTALYAEKYPELVRAIAPLSTVVSGKLSTETDSYKSKEEKWKKTGWDERVSVSKPGLVKRLKWSHMEDRLKYDLMDQVAHLTMPVLMVVGELDILTPLIHQKILFDKIPGPKEIYVIKGAEHTFREPDHLSELDQIFDQWIKKL